MTNSRKLSSTATRTPNTTRNLKTAILSAAAATMLAGHFAHAAESTWIGTGGGSGGVQLWTTSSNWTGNVVPAPGADIRFQSFNIGTVVNAVGDRSVGKLTLDTARSFAIQNFSGVGNTITLNSGDLTRTAGSANSHGISSNLALGSAASWNIGGTGELFIEGALSSPDGVMLEKFGPGALRFTSATSSIGSILAISEGTMTLDQSANFTVRGTAPFATVLVGQAGSGLVIQGGAVLNSQNDPMVQSGATALVTGANARWLNTIAPGAAMANVFIGRGGAGTLAVQAGGAVSTASSLYLGFDAASAGTLIIDSGGTVSSNYGAIGSSAANTSGVATVSGPGSAWNVAGPIDFAGVLPTTSGSLTISNNGAVTAGGAMTLRNANSRVNVNAGSLTVGGLVSFGPVGSIQLAADPGGGAALTITGAATAAFGGSIGGVGSLVKNGNATQALFGPNITYTGSTTINDGILELNNGMPSAGGPIIIDNDGALHAAGTVNRRLQSGTGSNGFRAVVATGTLTIGDPTRSDGINYDGYLEVGSNHVTLADADRATIGGSVAMLTGGRLASTNGINSTAEVSINGSGTISGAFANNNEVTGSVNAGSTLTFTGDFTGSGDLYRRITFARKLSPGNSGAANIQAVGTLAFGSASTFAVDLGGTTAGSQYDRLRVAGSVAIDGTLDVATINNFVPQQGQSFTVLQAIGNGSSITGQFDLTTGRSINPTTWLITFYSPTAVRLAVAMPGDASLDGTVNLDDFTQLAANFGTSGNWLVGNFDGNSSVDLNDFTALAANFGRSVASDLPRGSSVPEPTAAGIATAAALLSSRRRRRV